MLVDMCVKLYNMWGVTRGAGCQEGTRNSDLEQKSHATVVPLNFSKFQCTLIFSFIVRFPRGDAHSMNFRSFAAVLLPFAFLSWPKKACVC